jgi:hypothetical protein
VTTYYLLDQPMVPHPERRKLHTADCPWACSVAKTRIRTYREATPEEVRTHDRCSHCGA